MALVSCGGSSDDTTDTTDTSGDNTLLEGTWASKCLTAGTESMQIRKIFTASSATFSDTMNLFSDSNCQVLSETTEVTVGTYQVGNIVTTDSGVQGYEFDWSSELLLNIPIFGSFVLDGTTLNFSDLGDDPFNPGTASSRILTIDFSELNTWIKQ